MGKYTIGEHSYSFAIHRGDANNVLIGNYTSIAENTIIDRGFNHNTSFITTFPLNKLLSTLPSNIDIKGKDIEIGSDVWIGEGAVIMAGVNISHGAIIGCHAVVTKDVPSYAVVGGVPAKILRYRYTQSQIDSLLNISWWNWKTSKVLANAEFLLSNDIDKFIKNHL